MDEKAARKERVRKLLDELDGVLPFQGNAADLLHELKNEA